MKLSWLGSIFYGLITGLADFLPISSMAHQDIMLLFFGAEQRDPVRDFVVHIALLLTVYFTCRPMFEPLQRVHVLRRSRHYDVLSTRYRLDWRLVKTGLFPMLVGMVILHYILPELRGNLLAISGLLLLNGVFLFIPSRMMQGNKDAATMTQLDALLIGLFGSIGILPGLSRTGGITWFSVSRGADRQQSLNWAIMLSVPAFILLSLLDIIEFFSVGSIPSLSNFFTYILSGVSAFCGGYIGVRLARLFMSRTGFSGFAYYCWGASLLCFLLYLFAV